MPTFKIFGANAETGEEVQIKVQAESPEEAEAIASHRRIMVSRLIEVETADPYIAEALPHETRTGSRRTKSLTTTQTIEATGKRWKSLQLIGALGAIGSVVSCSVLAGLGENDIAGVGVVISILGFMAALTLFIVGRVCAWWFHG